MQFGLWRAAAFVSSLIHLLNTFFNGTQYTISQLKSFCLFEPPMVAQKYLILFSHNIILLQRTHPINRITQVFLIHVIQRTSPPIDRNAQHRTCLSGTSLLNRRSQMRGLYATVMSFCLSVCSSACLFVCGLFFLMQLGFSFLIQFGVRRAAATRIVSK